MPPLKLSLAQLLTQLDIEDLTGLTPCGLDTVLGMVMGILSLVLILYKLHKTVKH